ncbi:WD-40 repeat-containing protein [Reticulomyxa filosa]|uniref:WD-40 repeat-containing protein n=1 Tax=Reticulomyxa filosa TaxID=46433 RepID=X6NCR3_RETFI|nr:WD-40 repeat-containing protein [Reticulomyxa filosa]|eukprot:ETO23554.1 WD-40 repeat-containing protein [Reticulomyxa filosa]
MGNRSSKKVTPSHSPVKKVAPSHLSVEKVTPSRSPVVNELVREEEEEIKKITQHWVRVLNIKLGWINDFDKLVVKYATIVFIFDTFRLSSKLLKTLIGHTGCVRSIDCSIFNNNKFICSGSEDKTICIWNVESNKQIQLLDEHLYKVTCVKFSRYHNNYYNDNVICSSSTDKTINFWKIKNNIPFQIFNEHTGGVYCIEFSKFNGGRYLCSGSFDKTIRLWDIETSKSLQIFNGHTKDIWCIDISPLQSNNNNNNNNIGIIGGNGYTICSGSFDKTIRIWDIETIKQLIIFKEHESCVSSVKYKPNEAGNIILSGSNDKTVRLWDIRSGKMIQIFYGHKSNVRSVEYSPFELNNNEIGYYSNVICSGSLDNTIRFWDIRSNKKEIYIIKGDDQGDDGISCLTFLQLKKKTSLTKKNEEYDCGVNLCYGSKKGIIRVWG